MFELNIPTMTCQHCVQTISRAVMTSAPQASLHFNLDAHSVSIQSELAEAALVRIVEDSGYPVASVRLTTPATPGHPPAHHCEHCA